MSVATMNPPRPEAARDDGPLTAAHHRELARAGEQAKSIRKAARVAAFNGWATGVMAVLSAPFALFSVSGFLVFAALSAVAYNEFRGRKRLLRFDPAAASLLGWNQVGLLSMIVVYCAWMLYPNLTGTSALTAEMKGYADLDAALGSTGAFEALYTLIAIVLYGSVIVLSIIFQGANALYYFTRHKHVEAYVVETPGWILDLQRATMPSQ